MRRTLTKTLVAIAVLAISAFGADNSLGTWKLNIDKSKFTLNDAPAPSDLKSLTIHREASSDGGVKVTTTGEQVNRTPINVSFTAKYDGTSSSVTGSGVPFDTISIKRVDANTYREDRKNTRGSYNATTDVVISEDGKVMTWTHKGTTNGGKPFTSVLVFEKQ
jgi:hypothetical protein